MSLIALILPCPHWDLEACLVTGRRGQGGSLGLILGRRSLVKWVVPMRTMAVTLDSWRGC